MKTIFTLLMLVGFINIAIGQEDSTKTDSKKDTTRIVLGKKEIKIYQVECAINGSHPIYKHPK